VGQGRVLRGPEPSRLAEGRSAAARRRGHVRVRRRRHRSRPAWPTHRCAAARRTYGERVVLLAAIATSTSCVCGASSRDIRQGARRPRFARDHALASCAGSSRRRWAPKRPSDIAPRSSMPKGRARARLADLSDRRRGERLGGDRTRRRAARGGALHDRASRPRITHRPARSRDRAAGEGAARGRRLPAVPSAAQLPSGADDCVRGRPRPSHARAGALSECHLFTSRGPFARAALAALCGSGRSIFRSSVTAYTR